MITLSGTLLVKTVHGRRGDFAVGTLLTEIGEFKVKDTILDQFSEGEYRGHFAIGRIYQGSYAWKGATISELRANVTDIELDEAMEKSVDAPESPTITDPIEESAPEAGEISRPSQALGNEPSADSISAAASNTDVCDIESAIALSAPVKLDPTVCRELFRIQRDRLRGAGYRFDASAQTWLPAQNAIEWNIAVG